VNVLSLVLVGNSLPEQSSFIFTLRCSLDNGHSSSSSLTITTNSPPFGGALEVTPSKGVMLNTTFVMRSLDWSDEDLPLSYQFGYLTSSSFDQVVLRSKMELSYTSTLLPSGSNSGSSNFSSTLSTNSSLSCSVLVFDQLSSSSQSTFEVLVEVVVMGANDLRMYLLNGLNESQVSSNPEDLKSTLSSTSTVLNRANCSAAPDCMSLHRLPCSSTEGTCGDCESGFVGLLGSSNTLCIPMNEARRFRSRRLLFSISSSQCESDADCSEGLFLECNHQTKLCQSIQQTCPNSCSGHGRCVFVSRYDANVSVSECGVLDADCVPRCECGAGYVGSSSCSLSVEEVMVAMEVRQLIVEGVGELMSRENVDVGNVRSWMKTLSLVGSDYLSLSEESKRVMASLTIAILRVARGLGLSIEDLSESGMVKVVDMCVSGLSSSTSSSGDEGSRLLSSLLAVYSEFVASDMSEDQYPVSSVTPYLRSSSFFPTTSSSGLFLSIPETELESLVSMSSSQQSIKLSPSMLFPLQISIAEPLTQSNTNRNITNNTTESQLSLPLFLSLGSSPCNAAANQDCSMIVRMQHKLRSLSLSSTLEKSADLNPHSRFALMADSNDTFFEVDCVAGVVEDYSFTCPSGDLLTISCNGSSTPLRGRRSCPVRFTTIVCQTTVHPSSQSASSPEVSCHLSKVNESMSVCVCDLSQVGAIGDTSSVTFSIMSIERSVLKDFVSTWESASSLSSGDVGASRVVLATLGGLVLVFVMSMTAGIGIDWQKKQRLSESENGHVTCTPQTKTKPRWFNIGLTPDDGGRVGESSGGSAVNKELELIEECLPTVFRTDSLWTKFKREMSVYHRWLGIVLYYSPEFPRSMRVLSLFSSIVIMLFVQSVTYNIADPDDGSCEACKDESHCLSLRSTLNSRESRCYWETGSSPSIGSEKSGSCHFREIKGDMTRMFIVAAMAAIVSAPFALSVQYLIATVLSREVIDEVLVAKEKNKSHVRRLERALSQRQRAMTVSSDLVESCGRSSDGDMKNLRKELSEHYASLVSTKGKETEAKEFRGESFESLPLSSLSHTLLSLRILGLSCGE
jgi:hypothetical protein